VLTEWLYEDGIGEERALLIEAGRGVEARIERHDGVKPGLVAHARLVTQLVAGKRGIAQLENGEKVLLAPLPQGLTEGAVLTVEITRAAISEKTRFKLPMARAAPDKAPAAAPTFFERIGAGDIPVTRCHAHAPDRFAEHGWFDIVEEAGGGQVAFTEGSLLIAVTPAMTLIDIDGDTAPLPLSLAAAKAAALAIRRLDLQGSIGIDFPALANKSDRQVVAQAFDEAITGPFERTAINGFGLLHLVTRRVRPSLPEIFAGARMTANALALLRMGERDRGTGNMTLVGHPGVMAKLNARPDWLAELAKRTGRAVALRSDPKLATHAYYVEAS
jgi:hypothetical protein